MRPLILATSSRTIRCGVWAAVVAALALAAAQSPAAAGAGRWPALAAARRDRSPAVQRDRLIRRIRAQIDAARKVLATAESQAKMSEEELKAARQKLDEARSEIKKAEQEAHLAGATLEKLEAEILGSQDSESPLGKARSRLDEARAALDRVLHEALKLPAHPAAATDADVARDMLLLSDADKETLAKDPRYEEARKNLEDARREYRKVRTALLQQNPEWVAAADAAREARRQESEAKKAARSAAITARQQPRELRTQQGLADDAKATIAQGEAALRRLGVKVTKPKDKGGKTKSQ